MKPRPPYIHSLADVQTTHIGPDSRIWQFVVVLPGARIGADCNICSHCFIENDVIIGNRVTIKNGVHLWDGLRMGDDVFIGPNVNFTNDRYPRSLKRPENYQSTFVDAGATIGAGATLLPGVRIGRNAMVGAGAVVTRSVPPNAIVVGNPARISGYADGASRDHAGNDTSINEPSRIRPHTGATLHKLPKIIDMRGSLSVGEFEKTVPFSVKRYFLVFDVPSEETRGEHAHRACHQFLVCVSGSVTAVADNGIEREEFVLDRPNLGLHLPPMTWGIQYKYSPDAVLLVLASHLYDAEDYIRDYEEFLQLVSVEQ